MATYYVDVAGDDGTGDGSSGNPWATLAHAFDNSIAADTIIMNAGTHTWVSDTIEQRTIQGITAETTILDAGGAVNIEWLISTGDLTVNDITFRDRGSPSIGTHQFPAFEITSLGTTTFNRCIFHTIGTGAVNNNYAIGVMRPQGTLNVNSCIFYNIFKGNSPVQSQAAIITISNGVTTTVPTFTNCTFDLDNTSDPLTVLIADNGNLWTGTTTLNNCIINNRQGNSPAISVKTHQCNNCDVYQMGGSITGSDNITDDPLHIDQDNRDYRLQQNSPCIDAGTIV